jgi:hypothetical protein
MGELMVKSMKNKYSSHPKRNYLTAKMFAKE